MAIEAAPTARRASSPAATRWGRRWLHAAGLAFSGWRTGGAALLSRAFDAAPDAQLIVAADGGVVHANAAFSRIFPAMGGTVLDRIEEAAADASSASALRRLRADAATGGRATATILLRRSDTGAPGHFVISVGPIAGYPRYSLWNVEDVAMSRADGHSEAAALLDAMTLGWFSSDDEGRFLLVNKTLADWLGASPAELAAGGRLQDFFAEPAAAAAAPIEVMERKVALVDRHGTRFEARIDRRTIQVGEGTLTCAIVRNLTREREAASHLSREWFRKLFAEAPVGIALVDRSGRFVEANQAVGRLLDRDPRDLIGRGLTGLLGIADRAGVAAVLAADGDTPHEMVEVQLDGPRERTLVLYLGRLAAAGESGAASALHVIDVTERKNLERQFAQSQKMQAVGQLAGGIAHDFNNLLTAMIGFCDLLLLRCRPGDPSFADVMQIQQNASRAANLVRQLLAFSRQQALQPRIIDITDILVELSHLLRRLIGENIELELVHGRDLGLTRVDQGQFEQVVINLVVNARDAMPAGGRLTIRTRSVTLAEPYRRGHETVPAGEYVLVEVADNGVGIPPAHLERVFEPFFSTKEVGSGTGLGLSTVYGIVRQTGGFVFVDSVPGCGSNFQIYLPRCRATEPVPIQPDASGPAVIRDLTGSGRVMLVEDDDPVRIFGARALRNKGYTVLEAKSGEVALEQVRGGADSIDLLITDVVMPQMDGPRLVREVRELDPAIRVIFISGYAEDAFRQRLGSDSDIHFLAKPFSLKELATKVKEVLKTGQPGGGFQPRRSEVADSVRPRYSRSPTGSDPTKLTASSSTPASP
jgi:two-component system, cell cycle sensor histidine kinase and response regulator CckA